jgi:Tfp pilus assembly protein PilX
VRRRLGDERGSALVTAVILLGCMLGMGLAFLQTVDAQQEDSAAVRQRETAFNVAEAAMNAQIFALAQDWPGVGRAAVPYTTCTQASSSVRCPTASVLQAVATGVDGPAGVTWTTQVFDNGGAIASHFTDAGTTGQLGFDANGDGRVWVRAQATARGRTRSMVTLVRVQEADEDLPQQSAVISGRLDISNKGNKPIIDGSLAAGPTVQVRCSVALLDVAACLGHNLLSGVTSTVEKLFQLLDKQLTPNVSAQAYAGGNAMTAAAQARLKARAIADGTYFPTCPATPPSGTVVWIASGACTWTGNHVVNSAADPGLLVLEGATLYVGGTVELHSLVYALNPLNTTAAVVQVQGNAEVLGGVLIDGQGTLIAGSSKLNVKLVPLAFRAARSYVSAGMVQNTWRELPRGSGV